MELPHAWAVLDEQLGLCIILPYLNGLGRKLIFKAKSFFRISFIESNDTAVTIFFTFSRTILSKHVYRNVIQQISFFQLLSTIITNIVEPPPSTKQKMWHTNLKLFARDQTTPYSSMDHARCWKMMLSLVRPPRSGVIIKPHKSFLNLGSIFEDAIERPLSVHYVFSYSCSWPCP